MAEMRTYQVRWPIKATSAQKVEVFTRPLQVPMPVAKSLRCLDATAMPDSWQQAGAWAAEDAETLALRRGIVGEALREALPDLTREILLERPDWLARYAEARRPRGYTIRGGR